MAASADDDRAPSRADVTFDLVRPFEVDGGLAVNAAVPVQALDLLRDPDRALFAYIAENGVALPQGNALHADIRSQPGMFSIWGDRVYWSSSDASECNTNGYDYTLVIPEIKQRSGTFVLDRPFGSRGGLAAVSALPAPAAIAMDRDPLLRSCSVILEDGVPLPHPNAQHQAISELGAGRYSIWGRHLYFSASDGSDPGHNGLTYELVVPEPATARAVMQAYSNLVVEDDARLLTLVHESGRVNNTLANNFVFQCDDALSWLRQHGGVRGRAAVIGCGHKPWAPVRLLAEGFDEVLANDLFPVLDSFPKATIDDLIRLLRPLRPDLAGRLDGLRCNREGQTSLQGLTAHGECAFEDMGLEPGSVDFIFSNSVLEHVMDPTAVYGAMHRYLQPDGVAYHSIDLRDHLHYFDPLHFLSMSDEEYAEINTENRLRASDHLRLAAEVGLDSEVLSLRVLTPEGGVCSDAAAPPINTVGSWTEVTPAIDADTLASLDPAFAKHDPSDLSVVGIDIALRKPITI